MRLYGPTIRFSDGRISALDRVFKSQADLDKHWAICEQLAKRELSFKELAAKYGIHQPQWDALSAREKIHDEQYHVVKVVQATPNGNPFESTQVRDYVQRQREVFTGRVDRKKLYASAAAEWDAKQQQQADADAERKLREPTVRACQNLADRARFTTDAPLDDVRLAVNAVKQASTPGADLDEAKRMYLAVASNEDARTKAKRAELQKQMDELKLAMGDDEPTPEPAKPEPEPLTAEQTEAVAKAEKYRAAEERLKMQEATASKPGAKHSWESMRDLPYEERWEMHNENLEATKDA